MTDISNRYNMNQPKGKAVGKVDSESKSSKKETEDTASQPQAASTPANTGPVLNGDTVLGILSQLSGVQQTSLQSQAAANRSLQDFQTRFSGIMNVIDNEIPTSRLSEKAREVLALEVFQRLYMPKPQA